MDYDLRALPRHILYGMQEITQANLHNGFSDEEDDFWFKRHQAVNRELQARFERTYEDEDPDLSRTLSGAGRSAPVVPDPDDTPRDVQARVSKVDTSYRTFGRPLDRATAEGARKIGFRGASRKKP